MPEVRINRKLTAILSADVKGYSRLMSEDEVATVELLKEYRGIMTALIEQYHGRVVDSPGDNLLADFSSVTDAVQCAMEIQTEIKSRNAKLPENRRMVFRIGIDARMQSTLAVSLSSIALARIGWSREPPHRPVYSHRVTGPQLITAATHTTTTRPSTGIQSRPMRSRRRVTSSCVCQADSVRRCNARGCGRRTVGRSMTPSTMLGRGSSPARSTTAATTCLRASPCHSSGPRRGRRRCRSRERDWGLGVSARRQSTSCRSAAAGEAQEAVQPVVAAQDLSTLLPRDALGASLRARDRALGRAGAATGGEGQCRWCGVALAKLVVDAGE